MRKYYVLFLVAFLLTGLGVKAQIDNNDFNVTPTANNLGMCGVNSVNEFDVLAKRNGLNSFQIAVDLPSGVDYVPTTVSGSGSAGLAIAEFDITNLNQPIFEITGTWSIGNTFNFTYERTAGCDAVTQALAGGLFKDKYSITYAGGQGSSGADMDTTVFTYDLEYASLSIQSITTEAVNVGEQVVNRPITLVQGGNGTVDQLTYFVVVDSTATNAYELRYNGALLTPTVSNDTFFYDIDFSVAPWSTDFGPTFDNGETITFEETFTVTSCEQSPVRHSAFWGCSAGEACQTAAPQTGSLIFGSQLPNIQVTGIGNSSTFTLCDTNNITYLVKNINTNSGAAALDILINIGAGTNNVPPTTYTNSPLYAHSAVKPASNFQINGNPTPWDVWSNILPTGSSQYTTSQVLVYNQITSDPDGPGYGLEDLDGDGFYDDLAPGDSFIISYDVNLNPNFSSACGIAGRTFINYEHMYTQVTHKNQCGAPRPGLTRDLNYSYFGKNYAGVPSEQNAPSDLDPVSGGGIDSFTVSVRTQFNRSAFACGGGATERYQVRIPLPPGVAYDGVTPPNLAGSLNPVYFMDGDTLVYEISGDGSAQASRIFEFPLYLDCSTYTGGTELVLPYITRFICDGCINEDIECHTLPTIFTHCPGGCKGIVTLGMDNNRVNGGWTDETRTTKVVLDPMIHNTKYYLTTDTMLVTSYAYLEDTVVDNGYFRIAYSNSNVDLQYLNGEITINDLSSGIFTGPVTVAPTLSTVSGTNYIDFDLSSYQSLVSPTYNFGEGNQADTILVNLYFYIPNNFSSNVDQEMSNFSGRFYSLDASNNMSSCDVYGTSAKVHDPLVYVTEWLNNTTFNECNGTVWLRHGLYNRGLAYESLPGEYRPAYNMDSVVYTLPEYLEYIPNSASFSNGWLESNGDVTTVWDSINRTLIIKPAGNFAEPTFGHSFMHARIEVDVKCGAPTQLAAGGAIPVSIFWDDYAYNPDATIDNSTITTQSNLWTFNSPTFTIQSPNPTALGTQPTVSWDLEISKTSSGNTTFNWFRIDGIPGISIDSVIHLGTGTSLNVVSQGGDYFAELGNYNGSVLNEYRIYSTFTVCTDTTFNVAIGWNCNAYPTDYSTVDDMTCYTNNIDLTLEPQEAQVQVVVTDQPAGSVTMCQPFDIELEINSAQFADVSNPYVTFNTPGGPGAITVINDSVQVEYPTASGNIENVSVSVVGQTVTLNLMEHSFIDSVGGIFGTSNDPSANGRLVTVNMTLKTECNFVANSQLVFRVFGNKPCGDPATGSGTSSSTNGIEVAGAVRQYDIFTTITGPSNGIQGCGEIDTLDFQATVIAPGTNQTGMVDSAILYLPIGVDYVPGSYNCYSADCPTLVAEDSLFGQKILRLSYPAGIGNNGVFQYTIEVTTSDSVCSNNDMIELSSFVGYGGVACDTFICPNVKVETGNSTLTVPITKPNVIVQVPNSNARATYVPSLNAYSLLLDLYNSDASLTMDSGYVFSVYCADSAGNIAGPSIFSDNTSQQIPPMGMITEMYEFSSSEQCNEIDGVIVEFVPSSTNCQCSSVRYLVPLEILPPVEAFDDMDTTDPGIPVIIEVLANDSNYLSTFDTTSVDVVNTPLNGMASSNPDGTITYTPDPSFSGLDSFTYIICTQEVAANCDTATVTVYVNNTTEAEDDVNATSEGTPVDGNVLTNNTDPQGDMQLVNPTPVMDVSNGTLLLNPNGSYTYTPNPGFTGTDVFQYEVCDDGTPVACDTATVYIDVAPRPTPGNDAPVAITDMATTETDVPVDMNLLSNDSDPDGDSLIINTTPVSLPDSGTVVINPDGTATYTPNPGFEGTDTFEYTICDPLGLCDTAIAIVTVIPDIENVVFANDDAGTGIQDEDISGDLLANDSDPEGDTYFVNSTTPVSDVSNGSVVINNDGTYTYTPDPGYTGNDQFTYELCDNGIPQACDTATVYLTVYPAPNTTEAVDDINSTPQDIPVAGNVLTNDNDDQGDNQLVDVTPVSNPTNGTVSIFPNGNYNYTPNPGFTGDDSFEYTVCDDGSPVVCDTATVYITVVADPTGDNNPPVANNDVTTTEVDAPIDGNVITNDSDLDGDNITATELTPPVNGTSVLNPDGTYTYTPNPGYTGVDSFEYYICDDGTPVLCDTAMVYITIEPDMGNETYASDDAGMNVEDSLIVGDMLSNDNDPEGDDQYVNTTPVTTPMNGTVVINPDGTYEYQPNPGFVGNDQFLYEVCDNGTPVACDTASVYLTVTPAYVDSIVAVDDSSITVQDIPVNINVTTNDTADAGIDNTSLAEVTPPTNGTVVYNTDGTVDYTPTTGFTGVDSFEYVICDVQPTCDTAWVYVEIGPGPNTPPNAVNNDTTTMEDTPVVVNPLDNDTDLEGPLDTASLSIVTPPNNATATVDTVTGEITITPDPDFVGTITLEYEVCDTGMPVYCDIATITVEVTPVADTLPVTVPEDSTTTLCTTGSVNFEDPITNISICEDPENGEITPSFVPCLEYTPDEDYVGPDTICVVTCAGTVCDTTIFVIDVTPVNDPPVAEDDTETTVEDTPVTVDVLTNDSDIEGPIDTTTVAIVDDPMNGTAVVNPDGTVEYTPDPDFVGEDVFTYTVCDTGMPVLCDTAMVTITVDPVTDTTMVTVNEEEPTDLCTDTTTNFADPIDNIQLCGGPSNGTADPSFLPCVEYTGDEDFTGMDTLCVISCAGAVCDTTIFVIEVLPVNDPPVAEDDTEMTDEDTPVIVAVLPNDSDEEGPIDTASVAVIDGPANGLVAPNGDGTFTYTPDPNFVGLDLFTYVVCDTGMPVLCDTAVVTITVNPIPDTTMVSIPEEETGTLCTDSIINLAGPIDNVSICDMPDNGTIALPGIPNSSCVEYTGNEDYVGPDTVCIVTCSGAVCDTSIIIIDVTPVNDPPVAEDDTEMTDEDTPVTVAVLPNDSDEEGPIDTTTLAIVDGPTNGTAVVNPDGTVEYTPDPDFVGEDVFTYTVCDTGMPVLCDTAMVTITVNPVTDTTMVTVNEEEPTDLCTDTETNFADPIDNIQLCGGPSNGTADPSFIPCVEYTGDEDFVGMDTLCVISCAGTVCDTTIFIIEVLPVNDAPVAEDDTDVTDEDTPVTVDVLPNDSDVDGPIDTASVAVVDEPTNGTLVNNGDGTFTYTPDPDFVGEDVFTYTVCDTGMPVLCDTAMVTITVEPVTDTTMVTVNEEEPTDLCTDTETNFADPIDNIQLCGGPSNGTADPSFIPCVEYTGDMDFVGMDTLCVISCAGTVCDTTIFIIEVLPVNDAPVAEDDTDVTDEDTPVTVDVLPNDSDVDGPIDTASVAVVDEPTNGTLVNNGDGTFTYTPDPDFVGEDVFTYTVCDTGMPVLCDTAMVTITVNPVADTSNITTIEDTPTTFCTDSVTNFGAPIDNIYVCGNPSNGTIDPTFLPCVEYTPNEDYWGADTFCLVTCAGTVCDTTYVIVDVTPVVDVPVVDSVEDICETEPIPALTGTSEPGSVINWLDASGALVGTGSPFTPPATPGVNCYYAVAENLALGMFSMDTAEVCFTIDSLPTNVYAGPDDTLCGFHDYELQATGNGLVTYWMQIAGEQVALDLPNPNAIAAVEPNNTPGTDNLYTFVWTNVNGLCVVSDTVNIVVTNPHLTNAGNDTTICLPQTGGSVQLDATLTPSATGYWEYVGNGNIAFADSTDPQTVVDGLIPYINPTSTYRFRWYEVIGDCIAMDEVIITVNEAPGLDVADSDTSCLGSDYLLDAGITGVSQASYSWREDSPTGTILAWDEDVLVSPAVNTTYYVVASVSFGQNFCQTIDSIEIIIDGAPIAEDDGCYDVFEDSVLVGSTLDWAANDDLSAVLNGEVEFALAGGSQLDPASTLEIDNTTDTYVYTPYSNMSGVDSAILVVYNENCPDLVDTFVVCFNVIPVVDDPIIAVVDTQTVIAGTSVEVPVLVNDTLNDEAVDTVVVVITDPIYGSTTVDSTTGVVTYTSETEFAQVDSFEYVVCQYLVDGEELCDTTWVTMLVDGELYIPEGFTPNGDGINDVFEIPNLEILYPNASLKVFNRWGDEVWNSKGAYRNDWSGVNFDNLQLPDGTYFYIVELNNGSGRTKASYVVIYR